MEIIDLKNLVADPLLCEELVSIGLQEAAALAWQVDGNVLPAMYAGEIKCPAYTLEELTICIGGGIPPPLLPEPRPRANKDEDITWLFYFTDKSRSYKNGASAAADVLLYCLKNGLLKIEAVNERLNRKFNPF